MNIDSVRINGPLYEKSADIKSKQKEASAAADSGKSASVVDKLELSDEAKRLNPVKSRIDSGYYDRPEVLREVAKKMAQNLASEK